MEVLAPEKLCSVDIVWDCGYEVVQGGEPREEVSAGKVAFDCIVSLTAFPAIVTVLKALGQDGCSRCQGFTEARELMKEVSGTE